MADLARSTITTDGADGFGIAVYGVGSYTSYMYPGGLDVKQINVRRGDAGGYTVELWVSARSLEVCFVIRPRFVYN